MSINKIKQARKYAIYQPQKLVDGAVIGRPKEWFVAVPDKNHKDLQLYIFFEDKALAIEDWNKAEQFRKFPNQYGEGFYILGYFKWRDKTEEECNNNKIFV